MSGNKRSVLVLILALLAFGYVFTLNPGLTEFKIWPGKEPIRTSFALILFLFFLAGYGVATFSTAFREAMRSFGFWRFARRTARREQARRLVVEGRSNAVLGKTGAARRLLQRAQRKAPGEEYVALEAARVELADGKADLAERRLKALLKDAPRNLEVLSLLRQVYQRRNDFEGQVATLNRWLELDPGSRQALEALRDLYAGVGNWAEAVRVQGRLLGRVTGRSERAEERRRLARFRFRDATARPPAEARDLLQKLARDEDGFAPAHAALGDALLAQGEREPAVQAWTRGYQASGQVGLLLKVEELQLEDGRAEDMLKLYRKLGKKGGAPLLLRARLLLQLGRGEEALKLLEDDLQGIGGSRAGRLLAAEALRRAGSGDRAAEAYRAALGAEGNEVPLAFSCEQCHRVSPAWGAACPHCGSVDSLTLDVGALAPRAG